MEVLWSLGRCKKTSLSYECIRKVCQLMERCDGHGGDVRELGEVCQLTGSVTVISDV